MSENANGNGNGHGGARHGAGRKSKADEEKVKQQSLAAITELYGSIEKGFEKLLTSNEPSLIKFVWEHAVGKPREKMDIDLDGFVITWDETKTYVPKPEQ